jgi:hypothetical protein
MDGLGNPSYVQTVKWTDLEIHPTCRPKNGRIGKSILQGGRETAALRKGRGLATFSHVQSRASTPIDLARALPHGGGKGDKFSRRGRQQLNLSPFSPPPFCVHRPLNGDVTEALARSRRESGFLPVHARSKQRSIADEIRRHDAAARCRVHLTAAGPRRCSSPPDGRPATCHREKAPMCRAAIPRRMICPSCPAWRRCCHNA